MTNIPKPPPALACCRVLQYAILDEPTRYSGHSYLFRGEEEVGPVPCMAICQGTEFPIYLLHCGSDWEILGTEACASVEEAHGRAEDGYPGVRDRWIEANVSEEQAVTYLEEIWGPEKCNFCGKDPRELTKMIEKNGSRICYSCAKELYEFMRDNNEGFGAGDPAK